jgi:hypothetical protein
MQTECYNTDCIIRGMDSGPVSGRSSSETAVTRRDDTKVGYNVDGVYLFWWRLISVASRSRITLVGHGHFFADFLQLRVRLTRRGHCRSGK